MTVCIITSYSGSGPSAGQVIQQAIGCLPPEGGAVDARAVTGDQLLDVNVFSLASGPTTLLLGPARYSCTVEQLVPPKTTLTLNGTTLTRAGSGPSLFLGVPLESEGQNQGGTSGPAADEITLGSAVAPSFLAMLYVDGQVGVFGHVPFGNKDETKLSSAAGVSDQTLQVLYTSVGDAAFPDSVPEPGDLGDARYLRIENEIIRYENTTATTFAQCHRGAFGTTPSIHAVGSDVVRCVYRKYVIREIVENEGQVILRLDRQLEVSGSGLPLLVGPGHVRFDGDGTLQFEDTESPASQVCIAATGSRAWSIGSGIRFQSFNSTGCSFNFGSNLSISGNFDVRFGESGVELGRSVERAVVRGSFAAELPSHRAVFINERKTVARRDDGGTMFNIIAPERSRALRWVTSCDTGFNNIVRTSLVDGCENGISVNILQWVSQEYRMSGNDFNLSRFIPVGGSIFAPGDRLVEVADNLVRFYMRDASIVADSSENGLLNNDVLWPSTSLQVGGGSTIEIDLRRGSCFIATVTNTVQVTVTDPRFGISGQKIVVTVENLGGIPGSGVTFGSSYLMEGDLELPAVGKRRSISFVYDGTFWVETGRTGDVG